MRLLWLILAIHYHTYQQIVHRAKKSPHQGVGRTASDSFVLRQTGRNTTKS
jgi:hypothetical protein